METVAIAVFGVGSTVSVLLAAMTCCWCVVCGGFRCLSGPCYWLGKLAVLVRAILFGMLCATVFSGAAWLAYAVYLKSFAGTGQLLLRTIVF